MSVTMRIRAATLDDCRGVAEVHVESWRRAYRGILPEEYLASLSVAERESMWRCMVEQRTGHLLVACSIAEVVGFVAFGASRDENSPGDQAEIWAIYVKPEHWTTGVGKQLWRGALQQIGEERYESISLWVIANNERAIRFYERAGFVVEPQSRKFFELGGVPVEELRYVRHADSKSL